MGQIFGPQVADDPQKAAQVNARLPPNSRPMARPMAIFELLEHIVNQPPPKLPKVFSQEMRDFVDRCLKRNANERADLSSLMQHPWLAGVETDSIDIAEWVSNISKMPTP